MGVTESKNGAKEGLGAWVLGERNKWSALHVPLSGCKEKRTGTLRTVLNWFWIIIMMVESRRRMGGISRMTVY